MASSATTIGRCEGEEEPAIPLSLRGIEIEVDRKYRAWCERRGLNPMDVHDYGMNSGPMRLAIANQARAAVKRKQREKDKNGTTDRDI